MLSASDQNPKLIEDGLSKKFLIKQNGLSIQLSESQDILAYEYFNRYCINEVCQVMSYRVCCINHWYTKY